MNNLNVFDHTSWVYDYDYDLQYVEWSIYLCVFLMYTIASRVY